MASITAERGGFRGRGGTGSGAGALPGASLQQCSSRPVQTGVPHRLKLVTGPVHAPQASTVPAQGATKTSPKDRRAMMGVRMYLNNVLECTLRVPGSGSYASLPGGKQPLYFSDPAAAETLLPATRVSVNNLAVTSQTCEACSPGKYMDRASGGAGEDSLFASSSSSADPGGCTPCPDGTTHTRLSAAASSDCALCVPGYDLLCLPSPFLLCLPSTVCPELTLLLQVRSSCGCS